MCLHGGAETLDGSLTARVSAAGSNRLALRNGVATFKSVRVQARGEGEYKLIIGSHSKKVAIQEANVMVKVSMNGVCECWTLRGYASFCTRFPSGCSRELAHHIQHRGMGVRWVR